MAFVAYLSRSQSPHLDSAVLDCLRQHASAPRDLVVLEGDEHATAAFIAPSRGGRFPDGVQVLLSGRPALAVSTDAHNEVEAIHRLYLELGTGMVQRISGSFAIAVLDPGRGRYLMLRDRIGFVPLFYASVRDGLWVSDSLKPIFASRHCYFSLDHEAIYRFLYLKAFESPDTVVKEIKSAPPATLLEAKGSGIEETRYWDVPIMPIGEDTVRGSADDLERLLADAVSRTVGVSGERTGIMVSGGVDSAVLGCLAARDGKREPIGINVAFERKWSEIDESHYAQAVADNCGIPLTKIEFNQERLRRALPALWWNNQLPTANSGFKLNLIGLEPDAIGSPETFMLGEGADTLLSFGWNWKYFDRIHRIAHLAKVLPEGMRFDASGAMERFLHGIQSSRLSNDVTGILRSYLAANLGYTKWKGSVIRPEAIDKLFAPGYRDRVGFALLSRVLGGYLDEAGTTGFSEKLIYSTLKSYVPNQQLMNYHTACNHFGAELSCPYLDETVLEYCLKLPWADKENKGILKRVAERQLPPELVHREKCAFLMPMTEWIKTEFWPLVELVFSADQIEKRGLFDPGEMGKLKLAFQNGSFGSWSDIWTFVVLEAWMRINLDPAAPSFPNRIEDIFPELYEAEYRQPQRRSA
jgi:asparagine synthase (glutamine-hydrolysing)